MAEYSGIIAGVGEKVFDENGNLIPAESKNVIFPQFDARIRNFFVGEDCVLYGLEEDYYGISAGGCLIKGYFCILEEDIMLSQSPTYIFAKVTLYGDTNKTDEFSIVTSEENLALQNDDITNGVGTYYATLYYLQRRVVPLKIRPTSAENSETANNLSENGQISSTTTIDGEIDETDRSDRIASTKFVHDVIKKELDVKEINDTYTNTNKEGTYTYKVEYEYTQSVQFRQEIFTVCHLKRKAKICIGYFGFYAQTYRVSDNNNQGGTNSYANGTKIGQMPSGFYPKQDMEFDCGESGAGGGKITVKTNGDIVVKDSFEMQSNLMLLTRTFNPLGFEVQ